MSKPYELKCRLCKNNRERFDQISDVHDSDWEDVAPMGVIKSDCIMHPAYCPGHALGDVDDSILDRLG
jgi:hypothetical protein